MTKHAAMTRAQKLSKKSARFVVFDGEDFGADSVGQGGYQVSNEEDLDGFYNGCEIVAAFEGGHYVD